MPITPIVGKVSLPLYTSWGASVLTVTQLRKKLMTDLSIAYVQITGIMSPLIKSTSPSMGLGISTAYLYWSVFHCQHLRHELNSALGTVYTFRRVSLASLSSEIIKGYVGGSGVHYCSSQGLIDAGHPCSEAAGRLLPQVRGEKDGRRVLSRLQADENGNQAWYGGRRLEPEESSANCF